MQHRTSMKSFQALQSPAILLTSFHDLLVLLILLLSFTTFSSASLSFCIPEDSNLIQFSLLLLFLYVMCVQSNSTFFFLSDFLLTSDGWLQQQWKGLIPRFEFQRGRTLKMVGIFLSPPKIMPGLSLQTRQSFTLSYLLEWFVTS